MNWRSSPLVIACIAFAFNLIAMRLYVQHTKATPDILMAVGTDRQKFDVFANIESPLGKSGYDGQYYFAIAHAPFAKYGPEVDFPPGRQLRILFPLLGYIASFGNSAWLVYSMPFVNLSMLTLMTFLAAKFASHHGLSPWYGLTLPLCVNALMPALRNLTDTTAMTMAFALLYTASLEKKSIWIGLTALLAVLAREQNAALLGLVLLHSVWRHRVASSLAIVMAALIWCGWVAWLRHVYGQLPFLPTQGNFAPPFQGIPQAWQSAVEEWQSHTPHIQDRAKLHLIWLLGIVFGLIATVAVQKGERRPKVAFVSLIIELIVLKFSSIPNKFFGWVAFGYHMALMAIWALFASKIKREQILAFGVATLGFLLHVLGGPLIFVDYWAYGRAFFWLPMGLWALAVIAQRESFLMFAGAMMYLPVCVALHR